jgi:hypothetical protein
MTGYVHPKCGDRVLFRRSSMHHQESGRVMSVIETNPVTIEIRDAEHKAVHAPLAPGEGPMRFHPGEYTLIPKQQEDFT